MVWSDLWETDQNDRWALKTSGIGSDTYNVWEYTDKGTMVDDFGAATAINVPLTRITAYTPANLQGILITNDGVSVPEGFSGGLRSVSKLDTSVGLADLGITKNVNTKFTAQVGYNNINLIMFRRGITIRIFEEDGNTIISVGGSTQATTGVWNYWTGYDGVNPATNLLLFYGQVETGTQGNIQFNGVELADNIPILGSAPDAFIQPDQFSDDYFVQQFMLNPSHPNRFFLPLNYFPDYKVGEYSNYTFVQRFVFENKTLITDGYFNPQTFSTTIVETGEIFEIVVETPVSP
jgi:hypothetical protein